MKKILFIPSPLLPFPPTKGGAVQNLLNFIVEDNEVVKKNEIEVISFYNKEAEYIASQYKNCKVNFINIPDLFIALRDKHIKYVSGRFAMIVEKIYIQQIKRVLKKKKFDVVVFENTYKYAYTMNKYLRNTYKVLHLHNDYLNSDNMKCKMYADSFDEIACVSMYIENRVKEISAVKTFILYNGIDTERFISNDITRERVRKELKINDNEKVILFSGRIVKGKGVLELIKAYNKLESELNAVLLIIGSKIYGENITDEYSKEVLNEIRLSNGKVIMTGYIDYNKINEYYAAADIGVLPSIEVEALPLSVIEYLSAGLPVVISNLGGTPEILNEECGYIVKKDESYIDELYDKIKNLVSNKPLYNKCSIAAKERAKKFNKFTFCNNMWNFIDSINK